MLLSVDNFRGICNFSPLKRTMRIAVIDGHNAAYRFFFGKPCNEEDPLKKRNAVRGWADLLFTLKKQFPVMVAVFDQFEKPEREVDGYKGHRKEVPEGLLHQLPLMQRLAECLGLETHVAVDPMEGDDVVCSVVARERTKGNEVVIYSLDKDFAQLVGDGVYWARPVPGRDFDLIDEEKVSSVLGVTPSQVVSLLAIAGDSADNIKGVPGVGKTTAVDILRTFPDVTAFLAASEEEQEACASKRRCGLLRDHATTLTENIQKLTLLPRDIPDKKAVQDLTEAAKIMAEAGCAGLAMMLRYSPHAWKHNRL